MDIKKILSCSKCRGYEGYDEKCLPIYHFGNPNTPVMFLSINPSTYEYKYNYFKGLKAPYTQMQHDLRDNLTDEDINFHYQEQLKYPENPDYYKEWFDHADTFFHNITFPLTNSVLTMGLDPGIGPANVFTVDLFKCPTDKGFSDLKNKAQMNYIKNCRPFLIEQLEESMKTGLQIIFLNGRIVYDEFTNLIKEYRHLTFLDTTGKPEPIIRINDTETVCTVFSGELIDSNSNKKVLICGTSQRISSESLKNFNHPDERIRIAKIIESNIVKYYKQAGVRL